MSLARLLEAGAAAMADATVQPIVAACRRIQRFEFTESYFWNKGEAIFGKRRYF